MVSKQNRPERECNFKMKYKNKALALLARDAMNRKSPRGYMGAYKCHWCACWHIGHPPRKDIK